MPMQPLPADYSNPLAENNFGPLFEQYRITYGKRLEFVQGNLYDTVNFLSGVTVNVSIFDGIRNITNAKHLCNMPGNTLPDRQGFLVMALQFIPFFPPAVYTVAASPAQQPGIIQDLWFLAYGGLFELRLYEKLYAQIPLILMPAACGIDGRYQTGDIDVAIQTANNGTPDARNLFTLEEPIFIPPLVQIQAQASWAPPALVLTINPSLKFNLGGLSVRPVQ